LEKSQGRERIYYCQEVTVNFIELYYDYNILYPLSSLVRGEVLFVLNCWSGGGCNDGEIGITVVIFMYGIVVTAAIVGA